MMKSALITLLAGLLGATIVMAATAGLSREVEFKIASQQLAPAILEFSEQAGIQIITAGNDLVNISTTGVQGKHRVDRALAELLRGTGLKFAVLDDHTVSIKGLSAPSASVSSDALRVAQSGRSNAVRQTTEQNGEPSGGGQLEEIVVTAQKRQERLQDVPVPVTAISAESLATTHQLRLQDYSSRIPGLSVNAGSSSSSFQTISIRGITTGPGVTVGITVDDVPYGASTGFGGANFVPDIDPSSLARIEVLRGPQGTLYGASSLGGLIKFVTVDPSFDGLHGRAEVGLNQVRNGADPGYSVRGAVNVPLTDTFAMHASGFSRRDAGYIDNPVLGAEGVNEQRVTGGRLSALWRMRESLSLKLSALYQDFRADGLNDVTQGLGDLQQNYIRGIGRSDGTVQAYSATLDGVIGKVNLTSLSGYNIRESSYPIDYSYLFGPAAQGRYGVGGTSLITDNEIKKFSQEFRLSAPLGSRMEGLLGLFYTHEDSSPAQHLFAMDPTTGAVVADGYSALTPSTYRERAVFADLTVHVTDRFDLQFGGRGSWIRQVNLPATTVLTIFTGSSTPSVTGRAESNANPFTYLITPRLKLSSDVMLYARMASGYRAGGPNTPLCTLYTTLPCEFDPDRTRNYELGLKGDFLERRLSVDASVYYIDWRGIQLFTVDSNSQFGYTGNAGSARSQGIELAAALRPVSGLTIEWVGAWNDAELTDALPAGNAYGVSGDRLPYGSRFSGSLSIDAEFGLTSDMTGFVGGAVSYVGRRLGTFTGSTGVPAPRQELPAYAQTHLRAGVRRGEWDVILFANNLFDRRGLLIGGLDAFPPSSYIYIQPRTIGLSASKRF